MKLLLIRHGQSVGNAEGRMQGIFDSPLSELGRHQAQLLADRLRRENWPLATVYASDLSRAAETAEIVAEAFDLPVRLDPRLREYDVGELNGIIWTEIETRYPEVWHDMHHSVPWFSIPGAEARPAFRRRLATFLAEIQARHEEETVVVVSHGGSLGMLLMHLLDMDSNGRSPFRFGNASLSIVETRARGPLVSRLNDQSHLDGDLG
jgi:broad specificity phosphatase PhoE